ASGPIRRALTALSMSAVKPTGLRVVLDTNVYISAFTHPKGVPAKVWQQAITRQYTAVISPAIMIKIARVLRLDFEWDEKQLTARLKLVAKVAEILRPGITIDAIKADPDDNRIIECAVDGNADLIVSGDQHLLKLENYRGI